MEEQNNKQSSETENMLLQVQHEWERAEAISTFPIEIFGSMACPACTASNEVNANFCGTCGTSMP